MEDLPLGIAEDGLHFCFELRAKEEHGDSLKEEYWCPDAGLGTDGMKGEQRSRCSEGTTKKWF